MPSDTPTRPVLGGRGRVVTNESDAEHVLRMMDVVCGDAIEGEGGVCGDVVAKGTLGGDMAEKKWLDILEALRFERSRCLKVFFVCSLVCGTLPSRFVGCGNIYTTQYSRIH